MDNANENNNDLAVIANHYFKPKVYYINSSNVDWNYVDMPKYIQFNMIDDIIKKHTITSAQKKLIRNLTFPNINLVCKKPFSNLNQDVIGNIENFALDFTVIFNILRKIWFKEYQLKINNLIKENEFDKMWYDFDSNDYHYAKVSLEDLYFLNLKLYNTG